MTHTLVPVLEAFARFMPQLTEQQVQARTGSGHQSPPYALVIEGDAVLDSTGVVKTINLVPGIDDQNPPPGEEKVRINAGSYKSAR